MEVALLAKIRNGALVRYRQRYGYSQAKAAQMVDVTPATWNRIECMRFKDVGWNTIRAVADRLDVPVECVCPPELRKQVFRLDRVYFQDVQTEAMLAADQVRRLILPDPAEEAQRKLDAEIVKERLKAAMGELDDRERLVLELRHGLNGNKLHSLGEIGKVVVLTKERVRQIILNAEHKLRQMESLQP